MTVPGPVSRPRIIDGATRCPPGRFASCTAPPISVIVSPAPRGAPAGRRRARFRAVLGDDEGSSSMSDAANSAGRSGSAVSRRAFIGGSAAVAGSVLLGGCSGGEPSAGASPGANASAGSLQLTFLTILPPQSLTFAPELLADAGGHFASHGLDVRF